MKGKTVKRGVESLKFTALKEDIAQGKTRIYLLEGEEAYFTDRGVEMLRSAFVTEPTLNYAVFEGSALKGSGAEDFISSVYAYPFLSERRMVRVNNFYPTEREYERVKKVFESPCESTVLVIVNTKGGKAGADLKKKPNVAFVDCGKADEEDVVKWIFITLKKAGVRADASVCRTFAEYCSFSMSRIAMETQKLIAFAVDGSLSAGDIEELVSRDSDYKLYELTSAVARKNYSQYVVIMEDMLLKGYDEMSFLSALGNYYKNLYDCLLSPLSDAETGKALSMKEYAVKKNREQARKIGKDVLQEFFSLFFRAANDIKNGLLSPAAALAATNAKIFFSV